MTWSASPTMARLAARIRFGALALVALLIGHDAVYAADDGIGPGFGRAMAALGHDAYWAPFTAVVGLVAVGLALGSVLVIGRLQARLNGMRAGTRAPDRGAYRRELLAIWPRLLLAVILLFTVQENIETLLARGVLPGVDVLLGGSLPLAIPVLALITLALAALGALVRWRIATLRAQLCAAATQRRSLIADARPAREWASVDAAAPHRWIPDRRDAGRAPPQALPV